MMSSVTGLSIAQRRNLLRWAITAGMRYAVPGIAGLGIIIACVAFYDAAIRPLQHQLQQRQQLLNMQRVPVKAVPKVDWRTLQASLPQQAQADELAASIYRLAEAAQIDLREAEYKEESLDKARMAAAFEFFSERRLFSGAPIPVFSTQRNSRAGSGCSVFPEIQGCKRLARGEDCADFVRGALAEK